MNNSIPIRTRHLFQELDELLIHKLKSLPNEQWNAPTLAGSWTVKQIAAHLLDGNLRAISMLRDGYFGQVPGQISSYQDLVSYLNGLNADWILATNRLSPQVLVDLLETSGKEYRNLLRRLKPFEKALFSVAWAGEEESLNWFHVAREYTEKWHHTQQIFLATDPDDHSLFSKRFFLPYLETSLRALPYHYRSIESPKGALVKIIITGQFYHTWWMKRIDSEWRLIPFSKLEPSAQLTISDKIAWRIFTKGIPFEMAVQEVEVKGDQKLAFHLLKLLAVMA
ncbi:hypothetical protein D0X99_16795 [Algoriphagus lacus]|uniref:Mycothiol-dependent maleylpyruvate isomerase metal-binding domain-containing protein n=1 Tax=Algoriphagus lacus TaxID=2056311 RepID=A0A418PNM1_9BACT|nr:maleylpyruvate isomerase N-terminal domain-containing protein [Algoriphagus lacus]RIW13428.1 hypothetical protein D0X99_16795 [Algoriphagus lacus]